MKLSGAILGLVVLAGAGVAGGAIYTGSRINGQIQQAVQEVNAGLQKQQIPDMRASLVLESLERGLFRSTATYRLRLSPLAEPSAGVDIRVVDRIEHGPLPWSRLMAGQLRPVMAASQYELVDTPLVQGWFAMTGNRAPLYGQTVFGYDGSSTVRVQLAPLRMSEGLNLLEFSGMDLNVLAGPHASTLKMNGQMGQLSLAWAEMGKVFQMQLNDMQLLSQHQKTPSGLYVGDGELGLKTLSMRVPGQQLITLNQLRIKDSSTLQGDRIDSTTTQEVGSLQFAEHELGTMRMVMSLQGMNEPALARLGELLPEYVRSLQEQGGAPLQEQELRQVVEQLLDAGPRIDLQELSFRTASGEARLGMSLDLARPASWSLESPDRLIDQLVRHLRMTMSVDKGLIRDVVQMRALFDSHLDADMLTMEANNMADMAAAMAVSTQMGVVQGERISSSLDYGNGTINFNGQRIPSRQFAAMLQGIGEAASLSAEAQAEEDVMTEDEMPVEEE